MKFSPFLSDGAPTTLVSLIGHNQYRRCARDIYYFSQVKFLFHCCILLVQTSFLCFALIFCAKLTIVCLVAF